MPRAKKQCGKAGCDERVRGRTYCAAHEPAAWRGSTGPRRTQAMQDLREQVLREEPVCACGEPAVEAGHIVGHAYGGAYVRSNLRGQCRACNLAQMRADREVWGLIPPHTPCVTTSRSVPSKSPHLNATNPWKDPR